MYLGLMKLRFPLPYFHSGLGMTSWSLETSPTPVTVHRQPAKSPSWASESFASSLMFPLTTKFSWSQHKEKNRCGSLTNDQATPQGFPFVSKSWSRRIIGFQWAVNPHLSRLQLGLTGRPSRLLRESHVGPPVWLQWEIFLYDPAYKKVALLVPQTASVPRVPARTLTKVSSCRTILTAWDGKVLWP